MAAHSLLKTGSSINGFLQFDQCCILVVAVTISKDVAPTLSIRPHSRSLLAIFIDVADDVMRKQSMADNCNVLFWSLFERIAKSARSLNQTGTINRESAFVGVPVGKQVKALRINEVAKCVLKVFFGRSSVHRLIRALLREWHEKDPVASSHSRSKSILASLNSPFHRAGHEHVNVIVVGKVVAKLFGLVDALVGQEWVMNGFTSFGDILVRIC